MGSLCPAPAGGSTARAYTLGRSDAVAHRGHAASTQFQLDVYGEVGYVLHCARRVGLEHDETAWRVVRAMCRFVESVWREPDEGIWEVRGPRRPFTTFWLADNLALQGRRAEARALFERLLAIGNDVGLLSEEYEPIAGRLVGNLPQAFSHVGLINTARNLASPGGPAEHRQAEG